MKKNKMFFIITALLILTFFNCDTQKKKLEANKDLVNRFSTAVNEANWDALDDMFTEDFVRHCQATPDVQINSREAFIAFQKSFHSSFPDQKLTTTMMIAEGDLVAAYAVYTGTMTGPLGNIPPTGKPVESKLITFFRIKDNRIAEIWVEWDNLAMMTQLGLFPPPKQESDSGDKEAE